MTKYIGPKTADENVATQADKLSLSSATPDALTPDQAGAAGTATTAARSDHQHEILAGTPGTILPDDVAAEGSSTSFARADHTHAITAAAPSSNLTGSSTNSEGTATSFARSDHSHAITTAAPGTILPDDAAAAGTSANLARADHTHAIAAASAGTITGTNAEGTSTSFSRADHNHAFGSKSVPASALALGPTYETSLPGSPVDGQEIYYAADATNGVIWHLRYRSAANGASSGSGAWEFVGGHALFDEATANYTRSGSTAYDGTAPAITLPLKGDYLVSVGARIYTTGAATNNELLMSYKIGTTAASDSDSAVAAAYVFSGTTSPAYFPIRERLKTGLSAVTLTAQYRLSTNNAGQTGNFLERHIKALPRKVWA